MTEKLDKEESYIANEDFIHEYQGNFPPLEAESLFSRDSKNCSIYVYGRPTNWKDDFKKHIGLVPILERKRIKKVFVPELSRFTGVISTEENFHSSGRIEGIEIFDGAETEGLPIPPDSAGFFRTADCPTIVYHDIQNNQVIAAHAGFASLIDKEKILSGQPSRENESVVDDIVRYTLESDHYEIWVICGIGSESFVYDVNHRVYGEMNNKIFYYLICQYGNDAVPCGVSKGNISLLGIIRDQFSRHGFDPEKIQSDNLDTASNENLWSNYRAVREGKPEPCRNGVLVIHSK